LLEPTRKILFKKTSADGKPTKFSGHGIPWKLKGMELNPANEPYPTFTHPESNGTSTLFYAWWSQRDYGPKRL